MNQGSRVRREKADRQPAEFVETSVPLGCRCGKVQGVAHKVSPTSGLRLVCYCDDCQTFARFLQRPDVLDAAGGTDIFQMPPARVQLTTDADALRCLRLSERGVLRWYADCCRTPIANTAGPGFPLIGMIHSFMDHARSAGSRDAVLGAPRCRIYERSALGPLPSDAPPPPSGSLLLARGLKLLAWKAQGLARPNPFFDDRTHAPRCEPHLLTASDRAALWPERRST